MKVGVITRDTVLKLMQAHGVGLHQELVRFILKERYKIIRSQQTVNIALNELVNDGELVKLGPGAFQAVTRKSEVRNGS